MAGSLLKFVNVFGIELSNEHYENVGAYTVEHLKHVLGVIYNSAYLGINRKGEFTVEKKGFPLSMGTFYTEDLSTSLIYSYQAT